MPARKPDSQIQKIFLLILGLLTLFLAVQVIRLKFQLKSGQSDTKVKINAPASREYISEPIKLPPPRKTSATSVEQALQSRRSRRAFTDQPLTLSQISQLLWSAQGITAPEWGGRTAPSAKNAYPLELTVLVKNVSGLEPGVYHYLPQTHELRQTLAIVPERYDEAAKQAAPQQAPLVVIISADFSRMTKAFDNQPRDSNVYLEAGHAAQNLYLQVETLRLGTVVVGGYDPVLMQETLHIPSYETLIYIIPVGYPDSASEKQ